MGKPDSTQKKALLLAVICLAPGGFVLGATLAVRHYRRKAAARNQEPASPEAESSS